MKILSMICVCALSVAMAGCATNNSRYMPAQPARASDINVDLAADAMRRGNLSLAKEKLDRALEQNARNPNAHALAGMLYNRLGDTNKADSHYQRSVSLDPQNSEFKNNYAVYLCMKGSYKRGEKMAAEAAANRLYKTREIAYSNAATCARGRGDLAAAEGYFRQALEVSPRFDEALLQLADLEYEQKNYLSARGFFERYMEVGRTTPASLWLGVRIERGLGNSAVAQHYAQRLKREYPNANQTKELVESERNPG